MFITFRVCNRRSNVTFSLIYTAHKHMYKMHNSAETKKKNDKYKHGHSFCTKVTVCNLGGPTVAFSLIYK